LHAWITQHWRADPARPEIVGAIQPRRPKRVGSERWCRTDALGVHRPCVGYARQLGPRLDGHRQPNPQPRAVDHTCDRHRRCALPYAFRTSPAYTYGRRMHVQPHSSPVQLPDITVAPPAPGDAAQSASACAQCRLPTREQAPCACAGLQTANPPQHYDNLDASPVAASASRLLIGLPAPLCNPCDGTPALRDRAAIRAQNQPAAQAAQAGGVGMDLEEDARSETLSHSYSDAESSSSSIGRGSAASSSMASIGKRRRTVTSSAVRASPARPPMRRQLSTFTSENDQRLIQLVAEHSGSGTPEKWTEIAQRLGSDRNGKQCRERCPPPARPRSPGRRRTLNSSPTGLTTKHWALARLPFAQPPFRRVQVAQPPRPGVAKQGGLDRGGGGVTRSYRHADPEREPRRAHPMGKDLRVVPGPHGGMVEVPSPSSGPRAAL
jgi:hypothetical protein